MSILLDNAYDSAHVRPLLPATATCTAVVTSRNRLGGLVALDGAHPITLGPLPHAAAHIVFATRIGDGRAEAEPAAACPAEPPLQAPPPTVVAGDPGDDASAWFAAEHTALLRAVA